ncbi:hypothetical protein Ahy_B05g078350 [Arachis hypogaea]|uniref:Uncharacterized protein n=1 Tax=Arachis hypogaea TaxID=3818 RepID=A0A444Z6V3_ARAHY|nr:hypothetical protein Ahy_B05g078350 [Arachis hypogaea]
MLILWICNCLVEIDPQIVAKWICSLGYQFEIFFIVYGYCVIGFLREAKPIFDPYKEIFLAATS